MRAAAYRTARTRCDEVADARRGHRRPDGEALVEPETLRAEVREQDRDAEQDDRRDRRDARLDQSTERRAEGHGVPASYRDAGAAGQRVLPSIASAAQSSRAASTATPFTDSAAIRQPPVRSSSSIA